MFAVGNRWEASVVSFGDDNEIYQGLTMNRE